MALRIVTVVDAADLCDAIGAAGPPDARAVVALVGHHDAAVRKAVAAQLPYLTEDEPSAELLATAIRLTADPDPDVRDWACFALGQQWQQVDTPELRDALADRLDDIDVATRHEALVGLALRRDQRALPYVRSGLSRADGSVHRLAMVAAGALGDPTLHALTLRHQSRWDDQAGESVADCARRLTDPTGPGEDVLDGVAALLRLRAHGFHGDAQLVWWRCMTQMLDIAPHRAREIYDAVRSRLEGDELALAELRTSAARAVDAGLLDAELLDAD
ncbi:HEAT repeat domain-containing protein [Cellulomonas sp.]|uniref:HEAT repeat domain-containing protein n=1 Tax=Cellulomonas sp. TaxID=40001 RepID=UPI003BAC087B